MIRPPSLRESWQSPTLMTWLSQVVRLAGLAVLLPLVLSNFPSAEVSAWLLFSALASLQAIVDFGFGATFSREIAYGFAGRSLVDGIRPDAGVATGHDGDDADWSKIGTAVASMFWIYRRIALAAAILFALAGTWAAWGPVERVADPRQAWIAWACVVVAIAVGMVGNGYAAFLVGANRIASQKRLEALVAGCTLLLQVAAVLAGFGLLGLVATTQAGVIAGVAANRALANRVAAGRLPRGASGRPDARMVRAMWPAAWRTAVGTLLSAGISQGLGIAAANLFQATQAASVQLGLRVMQVLNQFAQAPYYSRIPELNRLRATGRTSSLLRAAGESMRKSLWILALGGVLLGACVPWLLDAIHSRTPFPAQAFWSLLLLAVFAERVGAMHVQLLLTRNLAIAHKANGGTAIAWLAALAMLLPYAGTIAIPLSMLLAYAGFYAPFSILRSHRELEGAGGLRFEARTSIPPAIAVLAYAALTMPWRPT